MLYDKNWDKPKVEVVPSHRQVLLEAADLIEEKGWCQGMYNNRSGAMCMMGAIINAGRRHEHRYTSRAHLRLIEAVGGVAPVLWNDAPERTQEEVVSALRKAAALA